MHFNPVKRRSNNNNNNEQNGFEFSSEIYYTLQINGTIIPEVQETKFLGVIIDNKLSWIPHINKLHKKLKILKINVLVLVYLEMEISGNCLVKC